MAKIIMFAHTSIFSNKKQFTFGPGIRIWEMAKALQKNHDVTIVEKNRQKEEVIENINFKELNLSLLNNITDYDVAYVQIWMNDIEIYEKLKAIPIIVDIYAPYLIEHIYYKYNYSKDHFWRFTDDILTSFLIPFKYGDFFICASERQKRYYLGMLSAIGRLNPYNINHELIKIVPYGINPYQGKVSKLLREKIPKTKKIILWVSAFFPWLDPLLTAEIMYELNKKNKDYALAVIGAKSPFVDKSLYMDNYNKFMKFVKKENMLNKSVFLYDWMDYEDLLKIYGDCNLFIVTYNLDTYETEFSYRVRMIEALQGKLPIISNGGDTISELVASKKMGLVIKNNSPKLAAKMILDLKEKDKKIMRNNIEDFHKNYTWDDTIKPIDKFCRNPIIDKSKTKFSFDKIIDERRDLIIQLRKEVDEKEGHIKNLQLGINKRDDYIIALEKDSKEIIFMDRQLKEKENEIQLIKNSINLTHKLLDEKEKSIHNLNVNKAEQLKEKERIIRDLNSFKESIINEKEKQLQNILHLKNDLLAERERKTQELLLEKEQQNQKLVDEKERIIQDISNLKDELINEKELKIQQIIAEKDKMINEIKIINQQIIDNKDQTFHITSGLKDEILNEKKRLIQDLQISNQLMLNEKDRVIHDLMSSNELELNKKQEEIIELKKLIDKHRRYIGEYKGSIIYPLYKITHNVGNTKLGKLLQKFK